MKWMPLLLFVFVTAITPGPSNLTTLYLSARSSVYGARRFMIGSMLGFAAKLALCGALNVFLAAAIPAVMPYLKWIGAAYMLVLAWKMLRSGFSAQASPDGETHAEEATYFAGILLQVLNIKSWVSSLSVFSVYVIPHTTALGVLAAAALVNLLFMMASTLTWAFFGSALGRVFRRHSKIFGVAMAASLVLCAVTAVL